MRPVSLTLLFATLACPATNQQAQPPDEGPPPDPITITLADLTEISAQTYPVEDGPTINITFTNFCEHPTEFGFTPDEGTPPIIWTIQPNQRQPLTIPKTYTLRARQAGTKPWTDTNCAAKNNHHLTFNTDCNTCTTGKTDPLERANCQEAGTCPN